MHPCGILFYIYDMSSRLKQIVAVCCVALLCLHFILVIHYTHFLSPNRGSLPDRISSTYVYPFFHQSWQMFVPAPGCSYALYVRTNSNGRWSNWNNLLAEKIRQHQANRVSGSELVALLYESEAAQAHQHTIYAVFDGGTLSPGFRVLNHAVANELRYQQHRSFSHYEILLVMEENNVAYTNYYKNLH